MGCPCGKEESGRILYHHRTQAEDAQGIHIYEMVKAFGDLGYKVEVAALAELDRTGERKIRGKRWRWLKQWGPQWLYEIMSLIYNLYGYLRLCSAIKTNKPFLIYERYALNTFCGIWASRRFGIPLVLEVNAPLYYEQSKLGQITFRRLARFSERWICSQSTWTIVVSQTMKNLLIQEGVPEEKMAVIANGIDPQKFHPHISGEAVRQHYGLEGKLVVGFIGWFRKWHGLEMLLEIMHEANLAAQGVRLLLVGDGPASPDLHRYTEQYHLQSAVIFTGPVRRQEIPAYIAAMDITVQPNATEYACPMKIFEYMAMGNCLVAPDQPNIREILVDGMSAYLFRPGDRDHFKTVLLRAIHNPIERRSVGQKACETIHERGYLWAANAEKVLNLVSENTVPQKTRPRILNWAGD